MREIRYFELESGSCVPVLPRAAAIVEVQCGGLWITVENELADYWLLPGQPMTLAPGARAWISAEGGPARFSVGTAAPAASAGFGTWPGLAMPRVAGMLPVFGNSARK